MTPRLLMIGAMYENGGNTTHRFLDGHPALSVYPFESQIGTSLVRDMLTSVFPQKYRWPVFALDATPAQDYAAIFDEECKVRARTPHVSKFRHVPFEFSDEDRRDRYVAMVESAGRSRSVNVRAFFRSTFEAWLDRRGSGEEQIDVGYSPIISVDAEAILNDIDDAHVVHVVRNPWSAYADTKRRPVPMSLDDYMLAWSITQRSALLAQARFPERLHVVRIEDVLRDPLAELGQLCIALGVGRSSALETPSWNGSPLAEVYPWGTIRRATPEANRATAGELSATEVARIAEAAGSFLSAFDYRKFDAI